MIMANGSENKGLLALGMGYVATRLARRLRAAGWAVTGTARDETGLEAIAREGARAFIFDASTPLPDAAWEGITHVLSSIPPDDAGDPALRVLRDQLIAHKEHLMWVGYLSTVGVYGDHGGAWVDETTKPRPLTMRGQRRLAAERAWLALHAEYGLPVHIFRLPGIYGPGRSPLDKARAGARSALIVKEGQVFSRIHVDDLIEALMLSMQSPTPGEIYNVTDDLPAPPHDVALFAHALLGMTPPPLKSYEEVADTLSPMARSFYGESKRVSNRKLKARLGWQPRYADYRSGLRAILAEEECGKDGS